MKYRADIDGMRTLAVTSVVFFHAGMPPFRSGFVGVDIFFVISGYLIGGIIFRDVREKRFSFTGFYARRARRILPALVAVLTASTLLGLLLLAPGELKAFSKEVMAAALGVSNIRYWLQIDYFAANSALNPLLMTWSLGVEEQFYVVFPFILIALSRLKASWQVGALGLMCLASLALGIYCTHYYPDAAFYLLPMRAWELGAGAMLAMAHASGLLPKIERGRTAECLGGAGLILTALSVLIFREETPFPGVAAMLPVAGAMLLLSSETSVVNRWLLSSRPLVFIGKISYSWYLWHWPLMSFARLSTAQSPSTMSLVLVAFLSLGLAVLSWWLVEQPFRRIKSPAANILWRYAGVLVVVIGCSVASNGVWRLTGNSAERLREIERAGTEKSRRECLTPQNTAKMDFRPSCAPPDDGRSAIALIGDSHANAVGPQLRNISIAQDVRFIQMTKSSCPPLKDASRPMKGHPRHQAECLKFNRTVLDRLIEDATIQTVVLGGLWSIGYGGPVASNRPNEASILRAGLTAEVIALQKSGKKVVILGDAPYLNFDPARELLISRIGAREAFSGLLGKRVSDGKGTVPLEWVRPRTVLEEIPKEVAAATGAGYIDLASRFCSSGRCRFAQGTQAYYMDAHHLSVAGSRVAIRRADIFGPTE